MSKGKRIRGFLTALVLPAVVLGTTGCARSVLNYQVAECIDTLGQYENNAPVESPKMQAEREQKESEEALEAERTELLAQAEALAAGYWYEEAIALLEGTASLEGDARAEEAIAEYRSDISLMYEYEGAIGHLCFPNLIADTERAFDGDSYAATYEQTMLTISEFERILNELYESGYILIDIHSLADETEGRAGTAILSAAAPLLPRGKKPIVFSVENLNYASVHTGDGVAVRLALDENGEVGAVYTDADGHELIGAYDVVPVLEQFIDEHPDFSYRGARGIISLSGANGVFGYQVEEGTGINYESNQETVREIAAKLADNGWSFASAGYHYSYMKDLTYDELKEEITQWKRVVGSLIGDCDTILYPYGSEVEYSSEKFTYLLDQGFRYFVGLWAKEDYLAVSDTYLRQMRRTVNGYLLENYGSYFSSYFAAGNVLDEARG